MVREKNWIVSKKKVSDDAVKSMNIRLEFGHVKGHGGLHHKACRDPRNRLTGWPKTWGARGQRFTCRGGQVSTGLGQVQA